MSQLIEEFKSEHVQISDLLYKHVTLALAIRKVGI